MGTSIGAAEDTELQVAQGQVLVRACTLVVFVLTSTSANTALALMKVITCNSALCTKFVLHALQTAKEW